jgi:hypothetical protein
MRYLLLLLCAALPAACPSPASGSPPSQGGASSGPGPTLQTLAIPGEPAFVAVAKDVIDVRFAIDPGIAAGGGLLPPSPPGSTRTWPR